MVGRTYVAFVPNSVDATVTFYVHLPKCGLSEGLFDVTITGGLLCWIRRVFLVGLLAKRLAEENVSGMRYFVFSGT